MDGNKTITKVVVLIDDMVAMSECELAEDAARRSSRQPTQQHGVVDTQLSSPCHYQLPTLFQARAMTVDVVFSSLQYL